MSATSPAAPNSAPSGTPGTPYTSGAASDSEGASALRGASDGTVPTAGEGSSSAPPSGILSGAVSRASGDTVVTTGPTTTISTIAVQSGNTRIVLALLQSGDWLELRVVELSPGLVYLGSTLEEALALQRAHQEVLTKLQSKQSPVEDLLNQADQLISNQRPRAEVYAAMAESLGLAWRDLNAHLETRKTLLDMSVTFHTRAREYSDALDAAEKLYADNVMPSDADGAKKMLSSLHDHKRAILEASMFTLQEAHALLAKLKGLLQEGGSMDSRPQHIRTNIEFACSQIEHYLESLHDRRRFLDGLFIARKNHLEQCLTLCLLYQDLTEAILNLKKLRDEISDHQDLGGSQANAEILLHEHLRREGAAKAQQDQCVRHVRTAEKMVASGHYAGAEARARAYSVLEAATALHETCDTRTALLEQSALFFRLSTAALTKLDQAEVQVAAVASETGGNQRLSLVMGVVEEAVQPALTEGYALLEVTGGRGQPHNKGVTDMVEQLEHRRTRLSSLCAQSTEKVLQRTEIVNSFLEMYNSIESWLVKIGDSFLRGHQDPGGSLSLAKDFLHLHLTLKNDLADKKQEIDMMASFLEKLAQELPPDDLADYKEKVDNVKGHWTSLNEILDNRISLSEKYVKFHEDAEKITNAFEELEMTLKTKKGDHEPTSIDDKWRHIQDMYRDLDISGKEFIKKTQERQFPHLDVNRAALCIEYILENLGKRKLVVTDLLSHYQMQISINKELSNLWTTYKETSKKMEIEMQNLEEGFCPLLRGDTSQPEELAASLEKRLANYVKAIKMIQEDIENMVTKAEGLAHSDEVGAERPDIVRSLLQLYQNLQNKVTDYQILGAMLIQWCKNIAEVHRSCDKLEKQFGGLSVNLGDVERQLKELDASKHAVAELLKFAQHEADSIIPKIRIQCPREPGSKDITKIKEMLERRKRIMDESWTERQTVLEKQLKRSQYETDLKAIRDQLKDLSDQLARMRGHYGDSLNAAMNMKSAFNHFKLTVEMLGRRIDNFVSTAEKMLLGDDEAKDVQRELADLQNKWSTFFTQVGDSQKSIELSIEFFRLVQETESWFKEGSQLLVNVAGDSSQIQTPDEAHKLQQKIESFLTPGEEQQARRITKITTLATQLFGDTKPQQVEAVTQQNQYMIDSFNAINKNLVTLRQNLKAAEERRQTQEKEQQELAASLAQAQIEAENARLAALAAEEARRVAEDTITAMAMHRISTSETVEVVVQTDDIPEPKVTEDVHSLKEIKMVQEDPQYIPPMFLTPLVGATVTEGVKFTFECRVTGVPTPQVEWLKDNLSIMSNPDYKTSFDGKVCALNIEETFTEDSALFTCKATNICGTAESSANLIVKEAVPTEVMAPPFFTKRLLDSSANEGSAFQLEATVTGHPLPIVSWWKNGVCLDNSPDYNITYNNGECILRFEELFQEDEAEYTCKATNDIGEDVTQASLIVLATVASEKPSFPVPLSNLMARAGQKFKLECEVSGQPTPSLAWFHNNKPVKETPECKITFDGRRAVLVISEAFPKNGGKYALVAKNTAGEAQTSSSVSVKGRIPTETSDSEITSDIDAEPVKPAVQQPLKDTMATEGETIRLDCIIIGQPEPEVIWYHDEKPVKESEDIRLLFHGDRCSLVIQEAFPEDIGVYKVVAMNSAGEASTSCHVNVLAPPEKVPSPIPPPKVISVPLVVPTEAPRFFQLLVDSHVAEGGPVTLGASVSGLPKPTIAWFKEGVPLLPDDQLQIFEEPSGLVKIHIPRTNLDHTGQYEVVASNSAGTAKCIGFLSIEPRLPSPLPAEPQEPPEFLKLLQDTTVHSGEAATFEAEIAGKPKPSVSLCLASAKEGILSCALGLNEGTVSEEFRKEIASDVKWNFVLLDSEDSDSSNISDLHDELSNVSQILDSPDEKPVPLTDRKVRVMDQSLYISSMRHFIEETERNEECQTGGKTCNMKDIQILDPQEYSRFVEESFERGSDSDDEMDFSDSSFERHEREREESPSNLPDSFSTESSQIIETGVGNYVQPIKLEDLWKIVHQQQVLLHNNNTSPDATIGKNLDLFDQGSHESGYFSERFHQDQNDLKPGTLSDEARGQGSSRFESKTRIEKYRGKPARRKKIGYTPSKERYGASYSEDNSRKGRYSDLDWKEGGKENVSDISQVDITYSSNDLPPDQVSQIQSMFEDAFSDVSPENESYNYLKKPKARSETVDVLQLLFDEKYEDAYMSEIPVEQPFSRHRKCTALKPKNFVSRSQTNSYTFPLSKKRNKINGAYSCSRSVESRALYYGFLTTRSLMPLTVISEEDSSSDRECSKADAQIPTVQVGEECLKETDYLVDIYQEDNQGLFDLKAPSRLSDSINNLNSDGEERSDYTLAMVETDYQSSNKIHHSDSKKSLKKNKLKDMNRDNDSEGITEEEALHFLKKTNDYDSNGISEDDTEDFQNVSELFDPDFESTTKEDIPKQIAETHNISERIIVDDKLESLTMTHGSERIKNTNSGSSNGDGNFDNVSRDIQKVKSGYETNEIKSSIGMLTNVKSASEKIFVQTKLNGHINHLDSSRISSLQKQNKSQALSTQSCFVPSSERSHLKTLKMITEKLKSPSKLSAISLESSARNDKLVLQSYPLSRVVCKKLTLKNNHLASYGSKVIRKTFCDECCFSMGGDNQQAVFSDGIFFFMMKIVNAMSLADMKRKIVHRLSTTFSSSRQVLHTYIVPIGDNDTNLPLLNPMKLSADALAKSIHHFILKSCDLATSPQSAILTGEHSDPTTPAFVQAGYFLIYVLCHKDETN